ncbi:2'-5' RNA ligase family protein [Profundibacterium mesophilum]|uniref:RNA ligase superfamily domain containing protein n=1 Tax=Profundibacterium mesophilum KAUST100406-0324 TaxID=1037889 RepID=A0A921NPA4_9RHOB|nr:2'-5' RNA ligase family protein [Profundibacterium mesophilum]KAF0675232.1 RNA ligase superfamily domain containing protein [Profundibacterium mesophilum KAUST100406-0324]
MALILTLGFDSSAFGWFEPTRQAFFPPARNFIPAHLTLFQQLPSEEHARVAEDCRAVAGRTAPLRLAAAELLDFGGGTAVRLDMPRYLPLLRELQDLWEPMLTRQDRQTRRAHVTLQNKVPRARARADRDAIAARFTPFEGVADRLMLWHYRGGPWEAIAQYDLEGEPA